MYNSQKLELESTFSQVANEEDLRKNKMNISVYEKYILTQNANDYKDIICPECGDSILINFNNYKISLSECKNGHKINNIFLENFKKTQIEDYNISCKNCNNRNLNDIKFYRCFTCGINICKKCKGFHDNNHNIINYNKKNYKCPIHNEIYNSV